MDSKQANKISLKLYLEGIEMPCASAQIIESSSQAPAANIQIPVDDLALDIKSRTTVHLFFKDSSMPEFALVFEGEVSTLNISKLNDNRTVSLDCVSISDHWNYAIKNPNTLESYVGQKATRIDVTFGAGSGNQVPAEVQAYRESLEAIADDPGLPKPLKDEVKDIEVIDKAIIASQGGDPEKIKAEQEKLDSVNILDDAQLLLNVQAGGIGLYNFASLARDILKSASNKGNLSSVISSLANDFARSNIGYTPFHIAYQISRRVFGFKNSKINSLIQSNDIMTFLGQKGENAGGHTSLVGMIKDFLDLFGYTFIRPAAPTYNESRGVPQSFTAIPETHQFSPIACNTIFKDEVITASFSRNHLGEITRLGTHVYPTVNTEENPLSPFDEIMLAPTGQLAYIPHPLKEGTTYIPSLLLTKEERLRGINGDTAFDDFSVLKSTVDANNMVKDLSLPPTDAEIEARKKKLNGIVRNLRTRWVDSEFQKRVLANRSFSVTTQYSPYRICGLPGLYMDDVLPCVIGNISSIVSSLDPNGRATSQITFSRPKNVRPEDKIHPKNKSSLEEWLMLSGLTKEETSNKKVLEREWPFIDEKWADTQKKRDRWIIHLRGKINNPEDLIFLRSWHDPDTYFPDQIGKKVYRQIMFGLAYDATTPTVPDFASKENIKRYKTTINEGLDGGLGRFNQGELYFPTGAQDKTENTNLIAHYIMTLQKAYDNTPPERKSDFADKFKRRRLVSEKEFWKFLVGLPDDKSITTIEGLGLGIRDSNSTISDEAVLIESLIASNKAAVNVPASAPFIKSRRGVIKNMRDKLLRNGYFIGGKS